MAKRVRELTVRQINAKKNAREKRKTKISSTVIITIYTTQKCIIVKDNIKNSNTITLIIVIKT